MTQTERPDARSKLSFRFIANACGIFTGSVGTRILCDPWLKDGVFDGSWCHFPPLETQPGDLDDVDAVYVSHLHPDHFDERHFTFDHDLPLIVLDHGPNFLIRKLDSLGYRNLIRIKDGETVSFREFNLTMYAPFARNSFHDAKVGNLIDSALVFECGGASAFNANDNTPTIEAAHMLRERFGRFGLAMINYNAAGPYPSCFDNLDEAAKIAEHNRILDRNFQHMKAIFDILDPACLLPFAGAYVLGGSLSHKNRYLGTTTWDHCKKWLTEHGVDEERIVLLRENDTFMIDRGESDRPYRPLDLDEMNRYITEDLSGIKYPYQLDKTPDEDRMIADCKKASEAMVARAARFGIEARADVVLTLFGQHFRIYPTFDALSDDDLKVMDRVLRCSLDERLLRRILDRTSHWNNAEIGAHISFVRMPNDYEPDLHVALQFFHL